jgi:hypothetical protein
MIEDRLGPNFQASKLAISLIAPFMGQKAVRNGRIVLIVKAKNLQRAIHCRGDVPSKSMDEKGLKI